MAERDLFERLDRMIDAIVAGNAAPALEPDLAMFAVIAADLRDVPHPDFKARLAGELFPGRKEQSMHVRPYLIVPGADALMDFLRQTFDAEVLARHPTPDGKVMHAEVRVGDSVLEMADAGEEWPAIAAPQHVYIENVDDAYARAIAAGATPLYEPVDQPYGDREGGVRDARGIEWFLATRLEGGPRPEGFGTVTSGFRAKGAQQMLEFLRKAFGAEHVSGGIEHAEVRVGETMIELSEAKEQWGPTRGAFHIYVADCDAAYAEAVRAGGRSMWAPEDKPYGERSAGIEDAWGNQWYIGTPLAKE